jgi:iron complex outermembrane receptor protein
VKNFRVAVPARVLKPLAAAALAALIAMPPVTAGAEVPEIRVTARKREENLQDIPVAVTAFSEQALEDRQIQTIADIGRNTPGLSFAPAFGRTNERPVIRGLGNVLAGVQFGVESGAAYFVDGIYYPGDLQSLNIREIERVEVIRGPQSALYGRNTYSGAINFITRAPGDTPGGDARLRYGQDGDSELTLRVEGPIVDGRLSGALSGRYYSFDGEYTNIVTGKTVGDEETRSVSGTLQWTPHEDLRVNARLSLQNDDDGTRAFFLQPSEANNCFPGTRSNATWNAVSGSTNRNQYFCGTVNRKVDYVALNDGPAISDQPILVPGVLDTPFNTFAPGVTVEPYSTAQGLAFSGVERELLYASLRADWDVTGSGWTVVASGAYRDDDLKTGSDSDHSSINYLSDPGVSECGLCGSDRKEATDYSVELRLESPRDARLRGMVGTYYYDQDIDGRDITFADLDGGAINDRQQTRNWAVFAMLEFDILDNVTATLEGRYFDEKKSLWQASTAAPPADNSFDDSASFSEFAPRLTIDWRISDQYLAYVIYARGYKPGGLNGRPGTLATIPAPTYGQEESDNYEIGLKSELLDGRLVVNTALFYIDVQDIQLTTPLSTASSTLTSIVTNQGSGEVRGAELEATLYLTEALSVGATYALADTEFTRGCDEFQWTLTSGGGILDDAANCTGFSVNGGGDGSIRGNAFPLSSKNQVSAFADFRTPVGDSMEFFAGADVSWEDRKPVQVHNLAFVPDATILNARLGIDTGTNLTVSVYGRNLTDEDAPAMVTRWLQEPLTTFQAVGQSDFTLGGAAPGQCSSATCARSYPRAFFGDLRRGRNFGVELAWRFGGDR